MIGKSAAPGIPDRENYGDLSQLRAGQLVNWIVQHHKAQRAGPHYDMRFGTPETGLFSWASRKEMPQPGQKTLAIQQPLHSHEYGQFEGDIPDGEYGAGTVKKHDEGRLLLTKVEPGKIHFTMAHKKYPERYVMVKTPKMGDDKWLLMNTTPTQLAPFEKQHYKTIPAKDVEDVLQTIQSGTSVQEKIDGASTLNHVLKDKIELLSHRQSKVTGGPIVHTERAFHTVPQIEVPRKYQGSVLRSEMYGTRDGKPIPVQELSGLLNSSLGKSLDDQTARHIQMRNMVYDVAQIGKRPVPESMPYAQRLNTARDILGSLTGPSAPQIQQMYHMPTEAKTPDDAISMWNKIRSGQNPQTDEGIVVHPPTGQAQKAKAFDENDVFIRGVFPGKGKYEGKGIGGFIYSHEPKGPIAGEVGTGFDDAMRAAMFENPNDYVGRRARVQHTGKLPSGALFQPSLLALHEDYPLAKVQ